MPQHHIHVQKVPRAALIGAAFLIVGSIALAASARSARLAHPEPEVAPIASIDLRFEDRSDGTIAVLDANTERPLTTVAAGSNGFVRGVLRGMFRQRKIDSLGRAARFTLAREQNNRLTLTDPENHRRIELDAFGPTNTEAFAKIFADARAAR